MKLIFQIPLVPLFAMLGVQQASGKNLTVAIYNGQWGDAINGCIVEPFAQSTHIKVTPERGMSTDILERLRAQKSHPMIDVAWMDGGVSELAAANDLLATIASSQIPGIAKMVPAGIHKTATGKTYALSTGFVAFGLVYNTRRVETPPSSWWDLWKPEFKEHSSLPGPTYPMGVPLLLQLNKLLGGAPTNLAPAMKFYAKLGASSFPDTLAASIADFRTGKVSIGAQYASIAWSLADSGLPINYAAPKEGALASDIRVHIVKGGKNAALARQFVSFAVAKEQASCMAEKMYLAPASKEVVLSQQAKARMPWSKDGSIADLIMIDWDQVHALQHQTATMWQNEILGAKL